MTEKEKCTHEFTSDGEPCFCDLSAGSMTSGRSHESKSCRKCFGMDSCVNNFTEEIRQQSELKGFNEGIDKAKKIIEDNMKYYVGVTRLKDAMKASLENLKRSG